MDQCRTLKYKAVNACTMTLDSASKLMSWILMTVAPPPQLKLVPVFLHHDGLVTHGQELGTSVNQAMHAGAWRAPQAPTSLAACTWPSRPQSCKHLSHGEPLLQVVLLVLGALKRHLAARHIVPGFLQLLLHAGQLLWGVRLRGRHGAGAFAAGLCVLMLRLLSLYMA